MKTSLRIITGFTGALIAFESLALLIGMHGVIKTSPWLTLKNELFAISDVVLGAALIVLALNGAEARSGLLLGLLVSGLVSHGYRAWSYLAGIESRFIFNLPLFILNALRIIGLATSGILTLFTNS
ncbi:MAG: hypothetical protein JXB35_09230 [Anaerolineae bacterium]|nr:hypothetical protein [Anaerolineae bacterium]